jgi:hypothetical protein
VDVEAAEVSADSVNTGSVGITGAGSVISSGDFLTTFEMGSRTENVDVTSTSLTDIVEAVGGFDNDTIPPGAALYGRVLVYLESASGETISVAPRVRDSQGNETRLDELEATSSQGASFEPVDTGWIEITTPLTSSYHIHDSVQGSVSGGTGTLRKYAFSIGWRVK